MLNTERFHDPTAGAGLFWKLLAFLTQNQGNEVIPDHDRSRQERTRKVRTTWYLDTPGYELQRTNITLHVRRGPEAKKRYKVTLKFHTPDRYTTAGSDMKLHSGGRER